MRKYLLAGAAALAGIAIATLAYGQITSIFGTALNGNEAVRVNIASGGGSGTEFFVTTGRLTSGNSYAYFSAFPASFTIGANAATAAMANGGALLINAANTAQTFTLPANPVADGTIISVCNATATPWATNAVTVAANSSQSLVGSGTLTTLAASTCAKFIWNLPQTTWFRVQ